MPVYRWCTEIWKRIHPHCFGSSFQVPAALSHNSCGWSAGLPDIQRFHRFRLLLFQSGYLFLPQHSRIRQRYPPPHTVHRFLRTAGSLWYRPVSAQIHWLSGGHWQRSHFLLPLPRSALHSLKWRFWIPLCTHNLPGLLFLLQRKCQDAGS